MGTIETCKTGGTKDATIWKSEVPVLRKKGRASEYLDHQKAGGILLPALRGDQQCDPGYSGAGSGGIAKCRPSCDQPLRCLCDTGLTKQRRLVE